MAKDFLPFALPAIGEEEIASVNDSLRSGWITTGPKASQFEKDFSGVVGSRHALAVNSATAGLHLALDALGVGEGDKVITTPYTFTSTAEVIRYMGADPVFVDIDRAGFCIDPELVKEAFANEPAAKAVMPVHFAGQACDLGSVVASAHGAGAAVVEDAAHSFPATYAGQMVGSIGDLTVFSFYATKTIATGEGGMVTTDNDDYAERIRCMRLHGINRDVFERYRANKPSWYYEVVAPGYKYNMPDIAAAIGLEQLKKAEAFRARREAIAARYAEDLDDLPIRLPEIIRPGDTHAWHLYVLQLGLENLSIDRDRFIELMAERGIGTSVHFIPLHIQPYWRDRYGFAPEDFPVAYDVYKRAVSLPIYPTMTDSDVDRVIAATRGILLQTAQ